MLLSFLIQAEAVQTFTKGCHSSTSCLANMPLDVYYRMSDFGRVEIHAALKPGDSR